MAFFRRASSSLPISTLAVAVPTLGLLLTLQACMGSLANNPETACDDDADCLPLTENGCRYGYGYGYGYGGNGCRD